MPTVLDSLRRPILGDEVTDCLQLALAIWTTRTLAKLCGAHDPTGGHTLKDGPVSARADPFFEHMKPSFGYEPLLMRMGWDQPAARAIAKFAVNEGRRQARESKACSQAIKDIKFLARGFRQRAAVVRRAKRLYDAWKNNNRAVGDLLYRANIEDFRFMHLAKSVADGKETDTDALIAMAAKAAPHLSLRRGPKISSASASHEFFLEDRLGIMRGRLPKPGPNRHAEYVDALTRATRAEFKNDDFNSRTARERVSRKRLIKREK